jgi:hypothetical protein
VSLAALGGCASTARTRPTQQQTPAIDLSPFRRIWIAGFNASSNRDIDVNAETVFLLRRRLNPLTRMRVVDAQPIAVRGESELADAARWRRLAEEYEDAIVVTGTVNLESAPPVPIASASSRASNILRKGFALETTFLFVDGRTGAVIARQTFPKEKLYGSDQRASTLSLYLELMERVTPAFLRVFR